MFDVILIIFAVCLFVTNAYFMIKYFAIKKPENNDYIENFNEEKTCFICKKNSFPYAEFKNHYLCSKDCLDTYKRNGFI